MEPVRVGIIGTGNISSIYLKNLTQFDATTVHAIADLDAEKAKSQASNFNITNVLTPGELLADPNVEIVLNITIPGAHYEISRAAVEAGKHVYVEKPLTVEKDDGRTLLDLAEAKGVLVGCAPDTVLGAGTQTCRKLIDDGAIGRPIGAQAFMMSSGVETWHPNPPFYYAKGGGPLFDMGPYYLSSLVTLMGPVKRVAGMAQISFPQRTVTSEPLKGTVIDVTTPTHLLTLLEFEANAIAQLATSFDVQAHTLPNIQIYGTEGTLMVPDPNTFGGPIKLKQRGEAEFTEVELTHAYRENARGLGLLDMAYAIRNRRPHRASGELAQHVCEIMHATHESAKTGQFVTLSASNVQPAAMEPDQPANALVG